LGYTKTQKAYVVALPALPDTPPDALPMTGLIPDRAAIAGKLCFVDQESTLGGRSALADYLGCSEDEADYRLAQVYRVQDALVVASALGLSLSPVSPDEWAELRSRVDLSDEIDSSLGILSGDELSDLVLGDLGAEGEILANALAPKPEPKPEPKPKAPKVKVAKAKKARVPKPKPEPRKPKLEPKPESIKLPETTRERFRIPARTKAGNTPKTKPKTAQKPRSKPQAKPQAKPQNIPINHDLGDYKPRLISRQVYLSLSRSQWEYLQSLCNGKISTAIRHLIDLQLSGEISEV
jgi:hypothetical protein